MSFSSSVRLQAIQLSQAFDWLNGGCPENALNTLSPQVAQIPALVPYWFSREPSHHPKTHQLRPHRGSDIRIITEIRQRLAEFNRHSDPPISEGQATVSEAAGSLVPRIRECTKPPHISGQARKQARKGGSVSNKSESHRTTSTTRGPTDAQTPRLKVKKEKTVNDSYSEPPKDFLDAETCVLTRERCSPDSDSSMDTIRVMIDEGSCTTQLVLLQMTAGRFQAKPRSYARMILINDHRFLHDRGSVSKVSAQFPGPPHQI